MHQKLKNAFDSEMQQAIAQYQQHKLEDAFYHLERAHILGQSYTLAHTRTHWWMLKVGWQQRSPKEVFGQCSRIVASVIFSKIWVPLGNTGGTNVNPLKPMPIPKDLQNSLKP
ncbi:DUF3703 domain-containing protein [Shewanella fidelis]|uniref:DUF3703 domain-containing protein n=1 Tax=Shewanella fidelis TaxID=173509 RepID=UPI00048AE0CD|nr:DUF3703 domain-containing protein [Shewanella fidelis]